MNKLIYTIRTVLGLLPGKAEVVIPGWWYLKKGESKRDILPSGTVVEYLWSDGDWARIRMADGKEGWFLLTNLMPYIPSTPIAELTHTIIVNDDGSVEVLDPSGATEWQSG